jgi:hypothetical protein
VKRAANICLLDGPGTLDKLENLNIVNTDGSKFHLHSEGSVAADRGGASDL